MPDRPDRRDWVVASVAAIALAIVLTWPWAIELWNGRESGDAGQFTWNAWWVAHQVLSLHNPWWTDYQFAPVGAYLTAHTLDTLLFAVLAPLTALIGPIPVYGLTIIGLHAAAAVLMWRLALAMGLGRVGAATAGILWASSPIVVFKATAHVHQLVLIASLPAALLLWRRLVRTGRVRDGVVLGGFLGAALLTDLIVAAYLLLALAAAETYVLLVPAGRRCATTSRAAHRGGHVRAGRPSVVGDHDPRGVEWPLRRTQGDRVASAQRFNADLAHSSFRARSAGLPRRLRASCLQARRAGGSRRRYARDARVCDACTRAGRALRPAEAGARVGSRLGRDLRSALARPSSG